MAVEKIVTYLEYFDHNRGFSDLVLDQYSFLSRVGPVDDNPIYFFPIFMKIELEIKDVSIRYQIKNYAKILVMGAINVKPILFVDFDSF